MNATTLSIQSIPAYRAECLTVEFGTNQGDSLDVLDELVMDDVYELAEGAQLERLGLQVALDGQFQIHVDTELGHPGAEVFLDCTLTLMPERGEELDALVLVEVDEERMIAAIYLLPFAPMRPLTGYRLVRASREDARQKLAQVATVAFTRGTHITLGTGAQAPIETLKPGDRVLTRDHGVQEVRWIGQTTTRAVGSTAPILIRAGALNNERDLVVSPDHRLKVYQRSDQIGAGAAQLLVRAGDLVNGTSVVVQDGGFVDYFQILFDQHCIIYAEGIAAESLLLDPVTRPALPQNVLRDLAAELAHGRREDHGLEVTSSLLNRPDAVDLLKRSSSR